MVAMRRFVAFGPALVVLLVAAVAVFAVPEAVRRIGAANTAVQIELARQTLDTDDILERLNRATRAIADSVEPSVVHIEVDAPSESGRPIASNGSGWVYDTSGHVVTNAHVVRNAVRVTAHFYDGRVMNASIVGTDPFTDIAVIKVDRRRGTLPRQACHRRPPAARRPRVRLRLTLQLQVLHVRGHRLRPRAQPARPAAGDRAASRTSSRPTPPSTPATPAGPSPTSTDASSA
jgi:hypothetical protein